MGASSLSLSGFEQLSLKDARYVKQKIKGVLATLGLEGRLLTVHLCDDAEIKALNRRFRKKNKATDVLSFEAVVDDGDPFAMQLLGDIVISVERAMAQAADAGHALKDELVVLFVHGLLHVLGYDHERGPSDAQKQAEAELFLLSEIDIPVEIALIGRTIFC